MYELYIILAISILVSVIIRKFFMPTDLMHHDFFRQIHLLLKMLLKKIVGSIYNKQ